jgi:uroporphyrinogen decarboxylase
MRQAGRVLPEYRALREKYSFLDLVRTPELCAEVTLQPLQRFNFDVAIIFSDILVIPEALGQGYSFRSQGGIAMDFALNPEDFQTRLNWNNMTDRLGYVRRALSLVRNKLDGKNALIGFSGSPWTLACFMTEGGHVDASKKLRAIQWYQDNPAEFDAFMNLLADAVTEYLLMQWAEGIDSAQIFDSLSTLVPQDLYWELSGKYIDRILRNLGKDRPMIVYSKGEAWKSYIQTPAQVLSVDWTQSLPLVKKSVGSQRCVQGNLDPALLT